MKKNESKIYLFKDRPDYLKKLTNDNIINITGEKGSGKSFFGCSKDEDDNYIVIHLDPVFSPKTTKEHGYSKEIRDILIKKYGEQLNPDKHFEDQYYDIMVEYLKKKGKIGIIEGGSIGEMNDISKIVGTLIVKRTSILKCFRRILKRDYNNTFFMKESIKKHGKLGKIYRFKEVYVRRRKIFKSYHKMEDFIRRIEHYIS